MLRHKRQLIRFIIALCAFIAFFEIYDYVPSRPWIYRQFATKYFVDVTAELEVDGETLTMKRTIRCIDQPRPLSFGKTTPKRPSVFDAVGGISNGGRAFIINVPDACHLLGKQSALASRVTIEYNESLEQVNNPKIDREPPRILEIVGNLNSPMTIYRYYPGSLDGSFYHVSLNNIKITSSDNLVQLIDGSIYDKFSLSNAWYAEGRSVTYIGRHLFELPPDVWRGLPQFAAKIESCSQPCLLKMLLPEFGPLSRDIYKRLSELKSQNILGTSYPMEYADKVFHLNLNEPQRTRQQQLPEEFRRMESGQYVYKYDFNDGNGPIEIGVNDCFYVSPDTRVFMLNGGEAIGVRR